MAFRAFVRRFHTTKTLTRHWWGPAQPSEPQVIALKWAAPGPPLLIGYPHPRCTPLRQRLWSGGPDSRYSKINTGAETVRSKLAFRAAVKERRCLLPAVRPCAVSRRVGRCRRRTPAAFGFETRGTSPSGVLEAGRWSACSRHGLP